MSIAAVVAWLWMAAQQPGPLPRVGGWFIIGDCEAHREYMTIDCRQKPSPTEHVIEIKTLRKLNGKAEMCTYATTGGELAPYITHAPPCDSLYGPHECDCGLSALREKWGVE